MCFIKKTVAKVPVAEESAVQEPVKRTQADASLTKNSQNELRTGIKENIKTSPLGTDNIADTGKKTLLGE